jgi:hypothetical protein
MSKLTILAAAIAALALAACEEGPSSNVTHKTTQGAWDMLVFAAKDGPILTQTHGAAFTGKAQEFGRAVLDDMNKTFPAEPFIKFTSTSAQAADKDYRIIWVVNPPQAAELSAFCANRIPAAEPKSGRLEIRAALCHRERLLTAVHGWMRNPDNAYDKHLHTLVQQMTRQVAGKDG